MSAITASMVKELRDKTGAGMMDCKKALVETGGAFEDAVDWLRKKGLAAAAKKAGRVAAEGLIGVLTEGRRGAVVEVNAETDFVARNEQFQGFVSTVARLVIEHSDDLDSLMTAEVPDTGRTLADELTHQVATIGENMQIRRAKVLEVPSGVVAGYVHNQTSKGLGKIGVLVALQSEGNTEALAAFAKQVAMHVAAAQPHSITSNDLDPELLERERAVLAEQARASGKPEEIVAKMVEGRLRKYYEEVVLLDQTFVIDGERTVREAVEAAAAEVGSSVTVTGFARFQLGEGVERKQSDFASEVAAQLSS